MTSRTLSPGAADALLFDLGRVVLDVDFNRTLAFWASHAGCDVEHLMARFARDELYRSHEKGEISDAEFFAGLRTSLGIELSDAQFIDGWNAIFVGEMPGIKPVLASFHDRFALLTSGRRTALPRHRALRAVLDWSYELLPEAEQRLLRHLAIFTGGFTAEAAVAVPITLKPGSNVTSVSWRLDVVGDAISVSVSPGSRQIV